MSSLKSEKLDSYKDLTVWQKSLDLVDRVYQITQQLPNFEKFSLSSQMQRSAVSIPSNIAEGSNRKSTAEFMQFLYISRGSAAELETQLIICKRRYPKIDTTGAEELLKEVLKMLTTLIRKLETKNKPTNH